MGNGGGTNHGANPQPEEEFSEAQEPESEPPPLRDIMEEVMTRETRDAAWANAIENRFLAEARNHDVTVERIQCGSARCALSLTASNRRVFRKVPGWFGDGRMQFEGQRRGDGFALQALYIRDGYNIHGVEKAH